MHAASVYVGYFSSSLGGSCKLRDSDVINVDDQNTGHEMQDKGGRYSRRHLKIEKSEITEVYM